jgi:chromosome segregation ATPase
MNRVKYLFGVLAFSLLILGVPSVASAQWRIPIPNRDDDYYGRNRGSNYGYLNSAIERLRNNSREFQRRLDRELDRSRIDGTNREDNLNRLANDFKNAADRLEDAYDNGRNMNRSYDEAQRVLALGERIDRQISRGRISRNIQSDWNRIRQDLRVISNAYGSGYNDRNRRNNGGRRNFPFPF